MSMRCWEKSQRNLPTLDKSTIFIHPHHLTICCDGNVLKISWLQLSIMKRVVCAHVWGNPVCGMRGRNIKKLDSMQPHNNSENAFLVSHNFMQFSWCSLTKRFSIELWMVLTRFFAPVFFILLFLNTPRCAVWLFCSRRCISLSDIWRLLF